MRNVLLLFVVACSLSAQVEIYGLRTYANGDEYRPPVIGRDEKITIEFDVTTPQPPNLSVVFRHADRSWTIDQNIFVNDPVTLRSEPLQFSTAPLGVTHYTYHFRGSFPEARSIVAFPYSGNYIYRIVDRDDHDRVLEEGRFIITENTVGVILTLENRYHPDFTSPLNQQLYAAVTVNSPAQFDAATTVSVDHTQIRRVDLIRNWELRRPYIIDMDQRDGDMSVENFFLPLKTFWRRNVMPGNEYRRLDLSSPTFYPNGQLVRLRERPDVSRFQWQSRPDANGASKLNAFTGSNADYLEVEMQLRLVPGQQRRVFLAGSFNNWTALKEYELLPDSATGLFTFRHWLRRGVYDYQYVLGDIDADGNVVNQDWTALEGNDWRTSDRFIALVYYKDGRFGGVDRVVGVARSKNAAQFGVAKSTSSEPEGKESPPVYRNRSNSDVQLQKKATPSPATPDSTRKVP